MKLLTTLKSKAGGCRGLFQEYQTKRWYFLIIYVWFYVSLSIRGINCAKPRKTIDNSGKILLSKLFHLNEFNMILPVLYSYLLFSH